MIEPSFTGHTYDSVLGIYFADARFYDAGNRQWMAMDPIKDGGNWYQYCYSNPLRYWDPTGTSGFSLFGCDINEIKGQFDTAYNSIISWAKQVGWGRMGVGLLKGIGATALIVAGIATIAATGGTALPVVVGSMSSTAIMWATQILGLSTVVFGVNDLIEAAQDFIYPLTSPQTPSDNILRDHVFAFFGVSPDEYYLIEAMVGGAAVAGAQVVNAFGLAGSSIGINEWLSNKSGSLTEGGTVLVVKTQKNVEMPLLPEGSQWERNVLNSFAGGKSTPVTYGGGTTLYRVGGKNGGFWSLDPPPATEYQWRVDFAIKQEFCNDASTLYKITIPEGSALSGLEGTVGTQGMGLYGGAHQVYNDYRAVPSDWIEISPTNWK